MPAVRIVGPGRAGTSLADALAAVGWDVALTRDPAAAGRADLVVIATPDAVIADVAARIPGGPVVAHLAGSLGLDVLLPHERRACLHPLATLPDRATGARTLRAGVWWAVEGDPMAAEVVAALGGRTIAVSPETRAAYHAVACIAANHTVALMAQVERVAAAGGLPVAPFYELAAAALENARTTGAAAALTGPAARGDRATIERHLDALEPVERPLYEALSRAAGVLACR